jgi:hypothetical protein
LYQEKNPTPGGAQQLTVLPEMVERIGHHFADEGKQAGAGPAPEAEHQFRDLLYKAEEERIGVAFPEGISPFRGGKVMVGRGDDRPLTCPTSRTSGRGMMSGPLNSAKESGRLL